MYHALSARELGDLVRSGQASVDEVAGEHLDRIAAVEPAIHALLSVVDARSQGEPAPDAPLAGVPVVVKDNICTTDAVTTCGSRMLERFQPAYDATVITRLRAAGARIIAKSNMDEFAMGSSTENSAFGPTRNPWELSRVPGGSSGGSAAAVIAGEAPLALGSDTGGSIRQPAALCGVVGMKPTYGRVSRYGLIAYASSLDQIGPIARTVEDAALLLTVIAGHDPRDSTSVDAPACDYTRACRPDVAGLRIGVPREYFLGTERAVADAVRQAAALLAEMGADVEECTLPSTDYALAAYYVIAPSEASSNLARYDGVRYGHRATSSSGHAGMMERSRAEGFGREVKQRIMIGTYALSEGYYDAYYRRAQQVRTVIRREFDGAFERFDALVTPTSPTVAFRLGERTEDPVAMKLADTCTIPANMAGLPAISVPCGFHDGLPIGLQIIGPLFSEETLFRIAY
ncbi:MAG: Asp-tRNA(Asn)/Glu-tRNA(Gln) amidotransferase subunit GatA, partial [Chthonomonadales bacterium]|nr:Asp-tRNA(Asn)/Glu-tRNA(Gln) amidotransferase subunit GatA [Chthonomonadales bacterium]